jgi:hypothetical protein
MLAKALTTFNRVARAFSFCWSPWSSEFRLEAENEPAKTGTPTGSAALLGQRHFGVDPRKYKHDAQASVFVRKALTRLRFVLVCPTKVALPK